MNIVASNSWADANIVSGLVSNPDEVRNPDFASSLFHQRTDIVRTSAAGEEPEHKAVLVNDTYIDIENNYLIENAIEYHVKLN